MRRPAGLLVILLMLLGARLRPVAVFLSVASPRESPFMPKGGGMGVDPARERAKALESAVLERARACRQYEQGTGCLLPCPSGRARGRGRGRSFANTWPCSKRRQIRSTGCPRQKRSARRRRSRPNERCRKGAQGSTLARCSPRQDESQVKAQGGGTLGAGVNASVDIRGSGLEFRGKSLMREVCPSCKLRGEREKGSGHFLQRWQ